LTAVNEETIREGYSSLLKNLNPLVVRILQSNFFIHFSFSW